MKPPACLTAHCLHTAFTFAISALLGSVSGQAASVTWTGATSTNFEIGTNWSGSAAPTNSLTTDVAVFSGTPSANQPVLTANRSLGGLRFGTATGGWTLGGGFALTLGATAGVGIDASAMTSGTHTISTSSLRLGTVATQSWLIGTGGTLNMTGVVTRLDASTSSTINVGDASNGGTLVLGGSSDNGYLGVTIANGTVELNKASTGSVHALGGHATINGGTLKLTGTGGDQIYSTANVAVNAGSFDLNGKNEGINQLLGAAAGGTTTNSSATASTLTITGGGTYVGAFTGKLSIIAGGGGAGGSTFSGSLTNTGDLTYNGSTGNFTLGTTGTLNNAGTVTNSGTGTGTVTLNGVVGSSVTGVVQNSLTSVMNLTGNNTFSSGLTILAGRVNARSNALNGAAGIGTITLGNAANTGAAATLNWDFGFVTNGGNINVVGTGARTLSVTSYSPSYSGAVTLNNTDLLLLTNNTGGSSIGITGGITGAGNLVLQSNATTGNQSHVNLSATAINNSGTITNSGTGIGTNGSLDTNISANIGPNVTGVIQNSPGSALNLSGTNSFSGGITIKAGTVNVRGKALGDSAVSNVGTITLGDVASTGQAARLNVAEDGIGGTGSGNNPINVVGTGARTLSVTNYNPILSGAVTLNGTDLTLLSSNTGGSYLTLTGGVTGIGNLTLQVTGTHASSAVRLTTNAINNTGTITNNGSGTQTNLISAAIGSNVTSVIQNSATSALTLAGVNTYSGETTIIAGKLTLAATGFIDNSSGVALGTNGTFDVSAKTGGYAVKTLTGSGNVIGALSVSTQLAIGNSPGTTTFDSLTLGASSTYSYELTGSTSPGLGSADLGIVDGDLTFTSGAVLDLIQLGTYTEGNKFTLFAYTGTLSGIFKDTSDFDLIDGATFTDANGIWQIDYSDTAAGLNGGTTAGASYVTVTAIPEPATVLLGSLGLLALLRRRR